MIAAAFFLIYFVWGTTFYAIRILVAEVPPFRSAGLRFLIAGSILLIFSLIQGRLRVRRQHLCHAAIVAALMFLAGYGGLFWSEQSIDSGVAALLVATIPVWIAFTEIVILKGGNVRPPLLLAIVLGLGGVALLTLHSGRMTLPVLPVIVLVLAPACWAVGTVLSGRLSLPEPKIVSAGVQMFIGGILLLILSFASGETVHLANMSLKAFLALLYLAIPGSVLAFTAYVWLLGRLSPTVVGTYAYVNPVIALAVGHALGGEALGLRTLIASALILGSVIVTVTLGGQARRTGH